MKLIIAAEIFPPDIGGPATYSKKLAGELVKKDWKVKVICYSTNIENDGNSFPVTRILRGQSTLNRYTQYFWNLFKLAKDCDVIYAQGPISSGLPAIIVGFLLSKKVIVKVVGDYAWEQARNSGSTEIGIDEFQKQNLTGKIGILKRIEKFVCQKAYKVIVPSQYLKKIVLGWGVDEKQIEVVYNSVGVSNYTISSEAVKKELILSVGRLVSWKGFEVLIEAVKDLFEVNKDFELKILGSGPDKDKLIKKCENLGISRVPCIKSVPHLDVVDYMSQAGMFVLNTSYEGLSHTILEAFAAGVPVITTNIGGNPELIKDGENGLLVEYNNKEQLKEAILKLYNNPDLRQKFITNSKEVLKKFSFEEMISKTTKVLEQAKK